MNKELENNTENYRIKVLEQQNEIAVLNANVNGLKDKLSAEKTKNFDLELEITKKQSEVENLKAENKEALSKIDLQE